MIYLEKLLKELFEYFYLLTGSYGVSIIFLSIGVTLLLTPFYYLTGILEHREKLMRQRLEPFIVQINQIKDSQLRHKHLQKLYKVHKYLPIYSLRSLSSLLIQIPFFIAAYEMLSHFTPLQDVAFLFIKDLASSDEILFGVNLLPILMTLINFAATIFMTSGQDAKDRKQSYVIAILFLVLLYTSPAGLVLYWTCNNFINMLRYLFFFIKEGKAKNLGKTFVCFAKKTASNETLPAFFLCCGLYFLISILTYGKGNKTYVPTLYWATILGLIGCGFKVFGYALISSTDKHFKLKIIGLLALMFLIANRMYIDKSMIYFLLIFFLFTLCNKWKIQKHSFKDHAQSSLFCLIAVMFPAMIYVKPNLMYFGGYDGIIYFAILIVFAVALPIFLSVFVSSKLNEITNLSIAFIVSAMFLPLIRSVVKFYGNYSIDFIVLFAFVFFVVKLIDKYKKVLSIFFICGALYGLFAVFAVSSTQDGGGQQETNEIKVSDFAPQELLDMDMKDTPNIYLFMHDAFPHKDLAAELDLDYSGIETILKENDFSVYDVYSLADTTLPTMSSVFDIKDKWVSLLTTTPVVTARARASNIAMGQGWMRVLSGYNFTNILLMDKGYQIWLEGRLAKYGANADDPLMAVMNKYGVIPQVLVGIMQGYLNTMMIKPPPQGSAMPTARLSKDNAGKDKNFAWGVAGPSHSTYQFGLSDEIRLWKPKYYRAIEEIREEVKIVISNDPDAIIIIMSDHGPHLLEEVGYFVENMPVPPNNMEIKPIHFRDKYGAVMAIRWPDKVRASKYDKDFVITQDLFPIVFAYLYDSPIPLKYKIKNTVVEIIGHKFDKGKMI